MPKAYYQCPICRKLFATKYQGDKSCRPGIQCMGRCDCPHVPAMMSYRGDGWEGRENLPHGAPPNWEGHK